MLERHQVRGDQTVVSPRISILAKQGQATQLLACMRCRAEACTAWQASKPQPGRGLEEGFAEEHALSLPGPVQAYACLAFPGLMALWPLRTANVEYAFRVGSHGWIGAYARVRVGRTPHWSYSPGQLQGGSDQEVLCKFGDSAQNRSD